MSEKEKKILKSISESINKMSDFEKGYILGVAESKVAEKKKSADSDKSNPEVTVNLTPIKISDGYAECDVRLVAGQKNDALPDD